MLKASPNCGEQDSKKFALIADALTKRYGPTSDLEVAAWFGPEYVASNEQSLDAAVHKVDSMFEKLLGPVEFGHAIMEDNVEPTILAALHINDIQFTR